MKISSSYNNLLLASVLAAPLAPGGYALAQDTAADTSRIAEIIVTAQRRAQSTQDIAGAISALEAADLERRGITQAYDLQYVVPNMQIGSYQGNTAIAIRGVGLNQGSPGVAVHVDGVYQPRPSMGDLAQIDLERVEIMRGPQGTLYGRNANGGVVNFISKAPTGELEGYVLGSYANYDESRLQAMINIPLSDGVRSRLVVDRWERADGFVENILPGGPDMDAGEATSARFKLSADLTENLEADITVTGVERSGPTVYVALRDPLPASVIADFPLGNPISTGKPHRTAQDEPSTSDRSLVSFAGALTWMVGDFTLKSLSGWQRFKNEFTADYDGTNLPMAPVARKNLSETFTQEFNLSGNIGSVDFVLGTFYMRDRAEGSIVFDFRNNYPGVPAGSVFFSSIDPYKTVTKAGFGDVTWGITDNFRLIGGLRYSKDEQEITQNNVNFLAPSTTVPTCPGVKNEADFDSWTPRAGFQYDFSADNQFYATYSKGFKIGGFNDRSGCGQAFDSEELKSYEVGLKNRLLGGALTLNVTAFYYDYADLQLDQLVFLAQIIANAPKAEVMGLEVESNWYLTDGWSFNGNLSLIDSEFKEFSNTDVLNPALGVQDVSGNPLPYAPKVTANVGLEYSTGPVIAGGSLTFRGDVNYRSRVYFREFDLNDNSQAGYTLLNGSITWDSANEKYSVRLFGKNLTDEEYLTFLAPAAPLRSRLVTWGPPRQFGVELRANF